MRPWLALALVCLGCDDGGSTAQEGTDSTVDTFTDAAVADLGRDGLVVDAALADVVVPDALAPDALPPDAAPPQRPVTEPGPFPVGYRSDEVIYQSPAFDDERKLRIVYWYPASAPVGDPPRYGNFVPRPEIHTDAPLSRASTFPVLVFSHGNGGFAEQSFTLTEFFASHGWVVIAFDHTGNTFNNMRVDRDALYEVRPQDVTAVLDHVYALEDDPLAGRLTERVVMSGHSFGGYTTLASAGAAYNLAGVRARCEEDGDCSYLDGAEARYAAGFGDERVAAAIPLTPAGAFVLGPGLMEIDVPTMIVTAGRDATLPNEEQGDPIWAGLARGQNLRLDFGNAGHFSFTSFCDILPGLGAEDGCAEDFTPASEVLAATNAYALAFARLHLLGDDSDADLLDGSRTLTDILTVTLPE